MMARPHIIPLLESMAKACRLAFELHQGKRVVMITPPWPGSSQGLDADALAEHFASGGAFDCQIASPSRRVWGLPFEDRRYKQAWLLAYARPEDVTGLNQNHVLSMLTQLVALVEDHQQTRTEMDEMAAVLDKSFEELALIGHVEAAVSADDFSPQQLPGICTGLQRCLNADLVFVRIDEFPEMSATVGEEHLDQHVHAAETFIDDLLARIPNQSVSTKAPYFCLNDARQDSGFNLLGHVPFRFLAARSIFNNKAYGWIGIVSFDLNDFFKRGQMRLLINTALQIAMLAANTELLRGLDHLTRKVEKSKRILKTDLKKAALEGQDKDRHGVGFLNQAFNEMARSIETGQALLTQSAQMATMGQLASVFAHEIKQPLTALSGLVHITRMQTGPSDGADNLELIDRTVGRMIKMVKRFGSFSIPIRYDINDLRLNDIVHDVYELINAQLKRQEISASLDLSPTLPDALGDAQGLQQVVLNLTTNAIQAMATTDHNHHELRLRTYLKDASACLDVEDTGPGIAREDYPKIFEPSYSTKTPDQGTGLGLAVARDIMKQFDGSIEVHSQPGRGCRFTLKIPCSAATKPGRAGTLGR